MRGRTPCCSWIGIVVLAMASACAESRSGGSGGSAGAGAGSGGMSGAAGTCSAPIDEEYCAMASQCPDDFYTPEECEDNLATSRCGSSPGCGLEVDAIVACFLGGTAACEDSHTVISGVLCSAEYAAYYACRGAVWTCMTNDISCNCAHVPPDEFVDPECTSSFDCCYRDLLGAGCSCSVQSVCDQHSETQFPRVPDCSAF